MVFGCEPEREVSLHVLIETSSAVAVSPLILNNDLRKVLANRQSCWHIGIILTGGNTNLARIRPELSDADVLEYSGVCP